MAPQLQPEPRAPLQRQCHPEASGAAAGGGLVRGPAPASVGRGPWRSTGIGLASLALLAACVAAGWALLRLADAPVRLAFIGGMAAAAATALGTLPMLTAQPVSDRVRDALLGFGAGVMLAASAFSLIVPALAASKGLGATSVLAALQVGAGVLLGALCLLLLDRWVPHEHFVKGVEGSPAAARALKRTWLFVLAITLHNLPEGLAIGVAYAGTSAVSASALATGITVQDIPEGLVIALALRAAGYGRGIAVGLGAASGLVEPVGAVLGALVVGLSAPLLPWGLACAAGAMLYVISHEIIPESHRQGHEKLATAGLMLGFVLMMVLDTAFG